MLKYFGNDYDYKTLLSYVGDFSQLAGAKRYALTCGRSKGVEAADVRTGSGLNYTVLLDRALDIGFAEYKGVPLVYMSPVGVVAPQYYDPEGKEWLRSFSGGLMTTCGLSNVGAPSELNGIKYGQHGRISNLPGENIVVEEGLEDTEYMIFIKGHVRLVSSFLENIVMHRSIKSYAGKNKIIINDIFENCGISRQPFMLLYHFNFGFPLTNENSRIIIPYSNKGKCVSGKVFDLKNYDRLFKPDEGMEEEPFFFETIPDKNGDASFILINDKQNPELAIKVKYSYNPLSKLIVWKSMISKNYALCIEPANCHVKGISHEYENDTLEYIGPSEKKVTHLEIEVLDGKDEISNWEEKWIF
jgi:hypothetical protein